MKKHSLSEHLRDVQIWYMERFGSYSSRNDNLAFFIAYERWLNDRPLLRDEDQVEPKP